MKNSDFFPYLLLMAGSTYLIRAIPFSIVRKKIEHPFVQSFLAYIPYAVLAAMTVPAVLYATDSMLSAAAGLLVAILFSYRGHGLTTVAAAACGAVFLVEFAMRLF